MMIDPNKLQNDSKWFKIILKYFERFKNVLKDLESLQKIQKASEMLSVKNYVCAHSKVI